MPTRMRARATTEPTRATYPFAQDLDTFDRMDQVIADNLGQFKGAGVISVRSGYKAVGGRLTRTPAIVVTVVRKKAVPAELALPTSVGDCLVDVRQASSVEKLRVDDPQRYVRLAASLPEFALSDPEGERDPETGQTLSVPALTLAGAAKRRIPYTPTTRGRLLEVNAPMAIVCHASPDAGWPQLKEFFGQIQSHLTVGLYDFTSEHILNPLRKALKHRGLHLVLTLDHPPRHPTADQSDEETVQELGSALGNKLAFGWALVRSSPATTGWIFPSAYHIKVAVRDGEALWLSSGDWNNSNQPEIDPLTDPAGSAEIAKKSDRDWHMIVEHAGLAKTYEEFLQHDNAVARNPAPAAPLAEPVLPLAAAPDLSAVLGEAPLASGVPTRYFGPKRIPAEGQRKIRIQPILTPDNYCTHVVPLIKGAQTSFYMQTPYIHLSDTAEDQRFVDLINAIVGLQRDGKDVRIILSQYQRIGDWQERLLRAGLDVRAVRIQTGAHNKGIVVDSKVVMLGSQNWSGDGVLRNRDASLIVHDEEAARYYEEIFLHDWAHMAMPSA